MAKVESVLAVIWAILSVLKVAAKHVLLLASYACRMTYAFIVSMAIMCQMEYVRLVFLPAQLAISSLSIIKIHLFVKAAYLLLI